MVLMTQPILLQGKKSKKLGQKTRIIKCKVNHELKRTMKEKDMRTFKREFLFKLWIVSSSSLINTII